jgi:hypothetical protein
MPKFDKGERVYLVNQRRYTIVIGWQLDTGIKYYVELENGKGFELVEESNIKESKKQQSSG